MSLIKVKGKSENSFDYIYGKWIFKEVKGSNEQKFKCKSYKSKFKCPAILQKIRDEYIGDDSLHNHPESVIGTR